MYIHNNKIDDSKGRIPFVYSLLTALIAFLLQTKKRWEGEVEERKKKTQREMCNLMVSVQTWT